MEDLVREGKSEGRQQARAVALSNVERKQESSLEADGLEGSRLRRGYLV